MRLKGALYVAAIAVLLVLGYFWRRKLDAKADSQVVSHALPKEDKAKYIVDENRHELIEIEHTPAPSGAETQGSVVRTTYLPPRASIEIRKDGTVVVTARQFGTECVPFIGAVVDSEIHGRAIVGVNLLYWHRWELGVGPSMGVLGLRPDLRVFGAVAYNVWSNTSVFVGIDNHKAAYVGAAIKF